MVGWVCDFTQQFNFFIMPWLRKNSQLTAIMSALFSCYCTSYFVHLLLPVFRLLFVLILAPCLPLDCGRRFYRYSTSREREREREREGESSKLFSGRLSISHPGFETMSTSTMRVNILVSGFRRHFYCQASTNTTGQFRGDSRFSFSLPFFIFFIFLLRGSTFYRKDRENDTRSDGSWSGLRHPCPRSIVCLAAINREKVAMHVHVYVLAQPFIFGRKRQRTIICRSPTACRWFRNSIRSPNLEISKGNCYFLDDFPLFLCLTVKQASYCWV